MKQTTENEKDVKPKFRADLVKDYKKKNGLNDSDIIDLLGLKFENGLDIENSTLRQYLNGQIQKIDIDVLKAMANLVDVSLDYFCYNTDTNDVKQYAQNEMGLWAETADNLIKNKPNRGLFNVNKRPKELSKKDYTAVLNLFLDKKIPSNVGKKSAIDVFTTNMLNLFICTVVYDKTILETFKENFTNLSSAINVNKTQPLGNDEIDKTFAEIFNSATIQKVYRNATNELHDTIDKLLETALKETFDSIKPNTTLF